MKIYIDDIRVPHGTDWVVVRTYATAVHLILANYDTITDISFDHDLGSRLSGYDIACEIETYVVTNKSTRAPRMSVHSRNPVGVARLNQAIESIQKIVAQNLEQEDERTDERD